MKAGIISGFFGALFLFAVFTLFLFLRDEISAKAAVYIILSGSALGLIVFSWIMFQLNRESSQKKAAEIALQLTRFSVDHASIPAYLIDREGNLIYVNNEAIRTLGYTKERLLKMKVADIDPDFSASGKWDAHWNEVKHYGSRTFETKHRAEDGHEYPVEVTSNFIEFLGKEYNWVFAKDISERIKREEDAVRAAREKEEELTRTNLLKDIASAASSSLGIREICARVLSEAHKYLKANAGSIYYLNEREKSLERLASYGYPPSVLAKIEKIRVDAETNLARLVKYNLPVLTDESIGQSAESLERLREAGLEDCRWFAMPVRTKGSPTGVFTLAFEGRRRFRPDELSLYRSIAEQIAISLEEARLFEAQREKSDALASLSYKYELILKTAAEGILGLDSACRQTFVNSAALTMLGYDHDELAGKPSHPIWHYKKTDGSPYPEYECPICDTIRNGTVHHVNDEVFWRKDGTSFPVEYTSTPIYQDGNIAGAVVTFSDITWRKVAEDALRQSEERFKTIYEESPIGIGLYDKEGLLVSGNRAAMKIFGVTQPGSLKGNSFFNDPNMPAELKARLEQGETARFEGPYDFDLVKNKNFYSTVRQGIIHISVLFTPLYPVGQKRPEGYLFQIQDITERKHAEEELRKANESLSKWLSEVEERNREIELLGNMTSLLEACSSIDEAYSIISKSLTEIFPADSGVVYLFSQRELLESITSWGGIRSEEQVFSPRECWAIRLGKAYMVEEPAKEILCAHEKDVSPAGYTCIPMIAQGETIGIFHLEFSSFILEQNEEARKRSRANKFRLASAVAESIALSIANFRLREKLFDQSIHDPLTGLYNRRYMEELLEKELHRMARRGMPLGLIMMDIDNFKRINDIYGHDAGDMLLREMGQFLERNFRGGDFSCRYGGEEFLMILPESSGAHTRDRAEQFRKDIEQLVFNYRGQNIGSVTISLGVAEFPKNGLNSEELIRAADSALYRAKAEGKNKVETV